MEKQHSEQVYEAVGTEDIDIAADLFNVSSRNLGTNRNCLVPTPGEIPDTNAEAISATVHAVQPDEKSNFRQAVQPDEKSNFREQPGAYSSQALSHAAQSPQAVHLTNPGAYSSANIVVGEDIISYTIPPNNFHPLEIGTEERKELKNQGYTEGLINSLAKTKLRYPLRIWLVDNSGSMKKGDGTRLVSEFGGMFSTKPTTRWNELLDCVEYHAKLAALIRAPTSFTLLNRHQDRNFSQKFDVAVTTNDKTLIAEEVEHVKRVMRNEVCRFKTPLTKRLNEIRDSLKNHKDELNAAGQKVVIVIATDGMPTSTEFMGDQISAGNAFVEALKELETFPVWIVIRICTDDRRIVSYYQNVDEQLEMSLELLDDFVREGNEVYYQNKWLNYALPLHQCRELGIQDRILDLIDERRLSVFEVRDFIEFLFGEENLPCPVSDYTNFEEKVMNLVAMEELHWNPGTNVVSPWIKPQKLRKYYGPKRSLMMKVQDLFGKKK